jgi:menaquinone-dependent protoporphyrinogen oxidase
MTGSTREVAQTVGEVLEQTGVPVDLLPLAEVKEIEQYAAVVLGAPMIMGWHRDALRFLRRHRRAFQRIPLAVFVTAMSLTQTGETSVEGVPVFVDEKLAKPPANAGQLSFRERYARLTPYLRPILKAIHPAKPASMGIFGGRLEYGRLAWWAVLFVAVIIQAPAGDRRNWEAIRAWAATLPEALEVREVQVG